MNEETMDVILEEAWGDSTPVESRDEEFETDEGGADGAEDTQQPEQETPAREQSQPEAEAEQPAGQLPPPAVKEPPQLQQLRQSARQRDIVRFVAAYPGVRAADIPRQVWDQVSRGVPLVSAYAMYENTQLKTQLAGASGLNSGTAGQAALARNVALQNDLNDLNMQETQTLADLRQKKADNDAWYNGAIAAAKAEGDAQKAQMLYQEKIRVEEVMLEAAQQKFNNEMTVYRAQMDAAQQQYDNQTAAMGLEYQQLRDSVADAQWQAKFDLAYDQWVQEVAAQREKMELQRLQWEQEMALQQAKLDLQRQELLGDKQYTVGASGGGNRVVSYRDTLLQ